MSHTTTETPQWPQENQAKEKGTLYTKILQDYRLAREQTNHHRQRAQRLQDNATRLTATFGPRRTTLQKPPTP